MKHNRSPLLFVFNNLLNINKWRHVGQVIEGKMKSNFEKGIVSDVFSCCNVSGEVAFGDCLSFIPFVITCCPSKRSHGSLRHPLLACFESFFFLFSFKNVSGNGKE